jgi:hypothetical protein
MTGQCTTGGLRSPLLCCGANVCRQKGDFCDGRTHVHRSGGRQPAVVRETHLQDDSISVRRTTHEERRASTRRDTEKRACNGERFPGTDYIRHARRASVPRGLTPPALVLRCECLPAKRRFLRWTNACSQERRASARRGLANALAERFDLRSANKRTRSGGRQPAVVPKNAPATGSDFRALMAFATHHGPVHHGGLTPPAPGCACGRTVTRAALRYRDTSPHRHGWLTPAAVGARCRSGEEITTFAVHKRMFSRAAGVSPPWFGKRTCRAIRFAFGE